MEEKTTVGQAAETVVTEPTVKEKAKNYVKALPKDFLSRRFRVWRRGCL